MYTLFHRHYQRPSASAETPQTVPFHIDLFCISHHNRDLKWRPRTGFKFDFLRVFLKNPTPEGFIVLFSQEKLAGLFLLKKVLKFSHERLDTNLFPFPLKLIVGSFSNDVGDGSKNFKKAIGLISKTATLLVQHTFLDISLPSLHDYGVKIPNLTFYGGRKQATTNFSFSFKT